jgi:hypothetical protein
MSSFEFWAGVGRFVMASVAVLSVVLVFGAMMSGHGVLDIPWLTR